MHYKKWLVAPSIVFVLIGCASEVYRQSSVLSAYGDEVSKARLFNSEPVRLHLPTGYERRIPSHTEFIEVGRIAEGVVLRPVSYVLTVEGANVHEAYLVVDDGFIVGFYLPVERAFSPLKRKAQIVFKKGW